jgi:hypothetical protein
MRSSIPILAALLALAIASPLSPAVDPCACDYMCIAQAGPVSIPNPSSRPFQTILTHRPGLRLRNRRQARLPHRSTQIRPRLPPPINLTKLRQLYHRSCPWPYVAPKAEAPLRTRGRKLRQQTEQEMRSGPKVR